MRKIDEREQLKHLDQGNLTLTNKRIVFTGQTRTNDIEFKKILEIHPHEDGIAINRSGKQKADFYVGINRNTFLFNIADRSYKIPLDGEILKGHINGTMKNQNK